MEISQTKDASLPHNGPRIHFALHIGCGRKRRITAGERVHYFMLNRLDSAFRPKSGSARIVIVVFNLYSRPPCSYNSAFRLFAPTAAHNGAHIEYERMRARFNKASHFMLHWNRLPRPLFQILTKPKTNKLSYFLRSTHTHSTMELWCLWHAETRPNINCVYYIVLGSSINKRMRSVAHVACIACFHP